MKDSDPLRRTTIENEDEGLSSWTHTILKYGLLE